MDMLNLIVSKPVSLKRSFPSFSHGPPCTIEATGCTIKILNITKSVVTLVFTISVLFYRNNATFGDHKCEAKAQLLLCVSAS
jgi:hypothetical protein